MEEGHETKPQGVPCVGMSPMRCEKISRGLLKKPAPRDRTKTFFAWSRAALLFPLAQPQRSSRMAGHNPAHVGSERFPIATANHSPLMLRHEPDGTCTVTLPQPMCGSPISWSSNLNAIDPSRALKLGSEYLSGLGLDVLPTAGESPHRAPSRRLQTTTSPPPSP